MEKVDFYLKLAAAIAVPSIAFVIRMIDGDTKNSNEIVISRAVQPAWAATKKKFFGEERF